MRKLLSKNRSVPELLRATAMFRHLTRRQAERLAALADEIHVDAGEVLAREEEPARRCYVVVKGWAEMFKTGRRLGTLGPGAVAGESAAETNTYPVTVEAASPMTLLMFDLELLSSFVAATPYSPGEEPPTIESHHTL